MGSWHGYWDSTRHRKELYWGVCGNYIRFLFTPYKPRSGSPQGMMKISLNSDNSTLSSHIITGAPAIHCDPAKYYKDKDQAYKLTWREI